MKGKIIATKTKLHVPCPTRTLDPVMVHAILAKCQNRFVSVRFYKTDGTVSQKVVQLRATSRLVGNERGQAQGERMKAAGQIWGATKKGSCSFYDNRVVSIRFDGVEIGVRSGQ